MKNNFKKFMKIHDGYISLIIGITLFVVGLTNFWLGFHNFDLGQNFDFLQSAITKYQLENNLPKEKLFHESTVSGKSVYDFVEMYREGIKQSFKGFFLSLAGTFLIGYGLRDYYGVLNEN